jgi:hypothetical protein
MTPEMQDKWVLIKWEWLAQHSNFKLLSQENTDNLKSVYETLRKLASGCAYCQDYRRQGYRKDGREKFCCNCPIVKYDKTERCPDINSTFYKWAISPTKQNAKRMLNLIKRVIKYRYKEKV